LVERPEDELTPRNPSFTVVPEIGYPREVRHYPDSGAVDYRMIQ
jgi:hypothetical protein